MFGTFSDFGRTFAAMDQLRRHVERAFDFDTGPVVAPTEWPRVSLYDTGEALVLIADVPGVTDKELEISIKEDVLAVQGRRSAEAPKGYAVHRQERRSASFARSFPLPCKVNADAVTAELKDGVLKVTLPKTPEAQPRQISVKAI
jgi:HSP20 family protein